jgi:ribosomal protein S18 acetylase RimI-like enzyme
MNTEVIKAFEPEVLNDILLIGSAAFPSAWIYKDAEDYYARMLRADNNIHIILNSNGKRVGYILAVPHNFAVEELKNDDPQMKNDPEKYYIETIRIIPESRGKRGLSIMLEKLAEECRARGINKISLHARVSNHLSEIIRKKFQVTEARRIEKWAYYNFEEPTDYIEAILPDGK